MKKIIDKLRKIFCLCSHEFTMKHGDIEEDKKKFLSLTEGETKIGRIYRLINARFNDYNKTDLWIQTENPGLGNQIPMDMMKQDRAEKLLKFIENSLEGNNP